MYAEYKADLSKKIFFSPLHSNKVINDVERNNKMLK